MLPPLQKLPPGPQKKQQRLQAPPSKPEQPVIQKATPPQGGLFYILQTQKPYQKNEGFPPYNHWRKRTIVVYTIVSDNNSYSAWSVA
ncbi:hypothetical protein DSM101010T_19790 [Desulfovibrio subterraneus]|uniref:Uncharacterized protein n=1 Tax=Desulfovibrio subterraneus TaxID=2718620 RepID=A0A7J0BKM2_9BACT|nr:hypothetical protein DSM101010T_19790 [Desulfovibrio subterraneus]